MGKATPEQAAPAAPKILPTHHVSAGHTAQRHPSERHHTTSPTTTIPVSADFMARAQYEEGKLCDTIVRCVVLPDPKRQQQERQDELQQQQQQQQQRQQQHREEDGANDTENVDGTSPAAPPPPLLSQVHKTDIFCHAVVLCARSPYFESCLGGYWKEAQTKTVEVSLENDLIWRCKT